MDGPPERLNSKTESATQSNGNQEQQAGKQRYANKLGDPPSGHPTLQEIPRRIKEAVSKSKATTTCSKGFTGQSKLGSATSRLVRSDTNALRGYHHRPPFQGSDVEENSAGTVTTNAAMFEESPVKSHQLVRDN